MRARCCSDRMFQLGWRPPHAAGFPAPPRFSPKCAPIAPVLTRNHGLREKANTLFPLHFPSSQLPPPPLLVMRHGSAPSTTSEPLRQGPDEPPPHGVLLLRALVRLVTKPGALTTAPRWVSWSTAVPHRCQSSPNAWRRLRHLPELHYAPELLYVPLGSSLHRLPWFHYSPVTWAASPCWLGQAWAVG
jgi:hypothetical protein